jgi:hypothetical protein
LWPTTTSRYPLYNKTLFEALTNDKPSGWNPNDDTATHLDTLIVVWNTFFAQWTFDDMPDIMLLLSSSVACCGMEGPLHRGGIGRG